jgi:serine/threonine protein kinase
MPVPTTLDEFLVVVRRSELIAPERLDSFLADDEPPDEPRSLAAQLVTAGLLTGFHAEQLLLGKYRGFTIGKYKVLERIGFGGNGTVYLCEHVVVRRRVAIKVLPAAKADSPTALTRFYREARAAGALDHPHLVKAHDIDEENGVHFLIMDYVDGTNLQDFVSRCGPLDPVRAANYIAQAALGLQAAHDAGLVHRDVKPGNILIDRRGIIRIADLGLARFYCDNVDPLTLRYDEQCVLGTADYVAPEQALNSHDVDGRADVYSLGATFHFLLIGEPLFPDGKAAQKLIAHQVKVPTPVRDLRPEVPAAMSTVVSRMVAKRPEDRYQTPAAVAEALAPWAQLPVAPPTDAELPLLSPAVRGPVTGEPKSSSGHVPRLPRVTPPATTSTPRPMQAISWESSSRLPRPETQQQAVCILASGRPGSSPDGLSRQTVAEGATQPDATPSLPSLPEVRTPPPAATPAARPRLSRRDAQALRLAIILTLGMGAGAILKWKFSLPAATAVPVRIVARDDPDAFPTITAALQQAPAGTRILVRAASWEESLRVPAEAGGNMSIEGQAPDGGPTHWRPPHGHPEDQPLLRVTGRTGLRVSGMLLDGEDRLQTLVVLAGPCPNLVVEDCNLRGFRHTGILFQCCDGTADRPVVVHRLRLVPGRNATAALTFAARADEMNRHLRISDCRLEGPYQAAVVLDGPTEDVRFEHNRICNAVDGILCRKATPSHPQTLALIGNTFCELERTGLHLETLPPVDRSRIAITNNLFARTPVLAAVGDFAASPAHTDAAWIWADARGTTPGPLYFRKEFTIAGPAVVSAVLHIACDPSFVVWVNGERVGHGEFQSFTRVGAAQFRTVNRRVYTFPVGPQLRPGKNVVAVEAGAGGVGGLLAQVICTCPGAAPVTLVSDASWKVRQQAPEGGRPGEGDDAAWPAACVVAPYGKGEALWQDLVWDGVIQDQLQGKAEQLFAEITGNVCDWHGREGFPLLGALSAPFELSTDSRDDSRFLRYPATSPLTLVGSPGVPPAAKP